MKKPFQMSVKALLSSLFMSFWPNGALPPGIIHNLQINKVVPFVLEMNLALFFYLQQRKNPCFAGEGKSISEYLHALTP